VTQNFRVIERSRRDTLGEGPLWSERENALYWTDILGHRLNRYSLANDTVTSWAMPGYVGWVIEREAGGLVVGMDRQVVLVTSEGAIAGVVAELQEEPRDNRVNDAKADAMGRIWAGTMPVSADRPTGSLYRIDLDLSVHRVDRSYTIANGPAIAPDGRFMYHTDTALRTIYKYDISDSGELAPRTPFIVFENDWGNPDGMTCDADGCLWVACWGSGSVMRFAPDGGREAVISLPVSQLTSCTFAGAALDRMFVTSAAMGSDEPHAGALFEIDPGCTGLQTHSFRG
jgi:sugar lactone lactonase YvrE